MNKIFKLCVLLRSLQEDYSAYFKCLFLLQDASELNGRLKYKKSQTEKLFYECFDQNICTVFTILFFTLIWQNWANIWSFLLYVMCMLWTCIFVLGRFYVGEILAEEEKLVSNENEQEILKKENVENVEPPDDDESDDDLSFKTANVDFKVFGSNLDKCVNPKSYVWSLELVDAAELAKIYKLSESNKGEFGPWFEIFVNDVTRDAPHYPWPSDPDCSIPTSESVAAVDTISLRTVPSLGEITFAESVVFLEKCEIVSESAAARDDPQSNDNNVGYEWLLEIVGIYETGDKSNKEFKNVAVQTLMVGFGDSTETAAIEVFDTVTCPFSESAAAVDSITANSVSSLAQISSVVESVGVLLVTVEVENEKMSYVTNVSKINDQVAIEVLDAVPFYSSESAAHSHSVGCVSIFVEGSDEKAELKFGVNESYNEKEHSVKGSSFSLCNTESSENVYSFSKTPFVFDHVSVPRNGKIASVFAENLKFDFGMNQTVLSETSMPCSLNMAKPPDRHSEPNKLTSLKSDSEPSSNVSEFNNVPSAELLLVTEIVSAGISHPALIASTSTRAINSANLPEPPVNGCAIFKFGASTAEATATLDQSATFNGNHISKGNIAPIDSDPNRLLFTASKEFEDVENDEITIEVFETAPCRSFESAAAVDNITFSSFSQTSSVAEFVYKSDVEGGDHLDTGCESILGNRADKENNTSLCNGFNGFTNAKSTANAFSFPNTPFVFASHALAPAVESNSPFFPEGLKFDFGMCPIQKPAIVNNTTASVTFKIAKPTNGLASGRDIFEFGAPPPANTNLHGRLPYAAEAFQYEIRNAAHTYNTGAFYSAPEDLLYPIHQPATFTEATVHRLGQTATFNTATSHEAINPPEPLVNDSSAFKDVTAPVTFKMAKPTNGQASGRDKFEFGVPPPANTIEKSLPYAAEALEFVMCHGQKYHSDAFYDPNVFPSASEDSEKANLFIKSTSKHARKLAHAMRENIANLYYEKSSF